MNYFKVQRGEKESFCIKRRNIPLKLTENKKSMGYTLGLKLSASVEAEKCKSVKQLCTRNCNM